MAANGAHRCFTCLFQYFSCTEKVVMAKQQVANAHAPESEVSCVLYSRDNKRLYSRASVLGVEKVYRI